MFIQLLFRDPRTFIIMAAIVCFSVCCHEFMHAYIALRCGDDTAARCGHLSLNPLRQMGWLSLLMLAFIGICWGQVPVDPQRFRRRYYGVFVALAGPLTNLFLALIFGVAAYFIMRADARQLFQIATFGSIINFVLAILNLMPVPGLDGWAAVESINPNSPKFSSEFSKGAMMFLMLALFAGIRYIYAFAEMLLFFEIRGLHFLMKLLNI